MRWIILMAVLQLVALFGLYRLVRRQRAQLALLRNALEDSQGQALVMRCLAETLVQQVAWRDEVMAAMRRSMCRSLKPPLLTPDQLVDRFEPN